jgi:hypothetical protein
VESGRVTFQTRISRGDCTSVVTFEVDLHKLSHDELERLSAFLAERHAGSGTTTRWFVLSLGHQLNTPATARTQQVRQGRQGQELLLEHTLPDPAFAVALNVT